VKLWRRFFLFAAVLWGTAAFGDDALWARLKEGGYVLLIRHAVTTPGAGDPSGFRLNECATQRNLTAEGREQAKRLGEVFRGQAIPVSEVRSSEWCRCLETARLAFGKAEPWSALSSLYADRSRESEQNRAIAALAATVKPPQNLVLVTHGANVLSILSVHPAPAEVVIARSEGGELKLVGRIAAP
jgi:broad specificity phosphatase PhoE